MLYTCNICEKHFDSPFKLGGHKSSHNRKIDFNKLKTIHCENCDLSMEVSTKSNQKFCSLECSREKKRNDTNNKMYVDYNGQEWDITVGEFNKIKFEDSVCEICGISSSHSLNGKKTNMAMDHDHSTGKFRGRLCSSCNRNLGWFEKNKNSIEKYLT